MTKTASVLLPAEDSERANKVVRGAVLSTAAVLWGTTALAQSLPDGGTVAAGDVTISQPSNTQLNITQGTNSAIVNWNGFSIGSDSTVNIYQPGQESVILNRVTGDTTSQIHGQLNANGQVFLVNPNGIFIGPNGQVSTGGFVASTLAITDEDFLNGRYRLNGNGSSASVENAGTISIVPGGYAALVGGKVSNSGLIQVPLGKVGLGAGEQVTLDVSGDGFLQVAVPSDSDDAMMEALVTNSGRIEAEGGIVHLKAASARDAARQVINMSGVIEAQSVGGVSGAVVLGGSGGAVQISGTIDTSARATIVESSLRPQLRGGSITVTGEAITLTGATLSADGAGAGDGGSIRIGGDLQGGGTLQTAHTTTIDANTLLSADGGEEGNGGRIIVWSDYLTTFEGQISARGGDLAGDGGFAEVSGQFDLVYRGHADLRAPNGTTGDLLLDPVNITIPGTLTEADLEAQLESADVFLSTSMAGTEDGNITINADLDWMAANTLFLIADNMITINGAINAVSGGLLLNAMGAVDGVGRITTGPGGSINVASFNLVAGFWDQVSATLPSFFAGDFIVSPNATFLRATGGNGSDANPFQLTDIYGLQGLNGSSQSFALVNDIDASPTSSWSQGFDPVDFSGTLEGNRFQINRLFIDREFTFGGLFGTIGSGGIVRNLTIANADVTTDGGGILAGTNQGTVSGVRVSGNYDGIDSISGGLVGINSGTIVDSFSDASVSVVTSESNSVVAGGLVGQNSGVIRRSHSVGPVLGDSFGELIVGGLVGRNTGTIVDSYSNSNVLGIDVSDGSGELIALGGLVGVNSGTITRTYSDGNIDFMGVSNPLIGGLVGTNSGSVSASFWDTQNSGQSTSDGGTGLFSFQLLDTEIFFDIASAQGWDFTNTWAPGSGEVGPVNYTTSPVIFAVPNDLFVPEGEEPPTFTTGTISGGPSVYRFGPDPDSLDTSSVFQDLNFIETEGGDTIFRLSTFFLLSDAQQGYEVLSLPGSVLPLTEVIPVPPTPVIEVTPTVDTTITGGGGGGTAVTTVAEAETALGTVENASQDLNSEIASCASSGENVSEYLACLAEAMDDYASDLDGIVKGLPPGLESVGDIIRGASAGIRQAGEDANRRLSLATTAEERNAIRREAVQQARREIRQAQREIRKAITLIRANDPELAIVQNQQVETIVAAVGQAEIGLTRAIGL